MTFPEGGEIMKIAERSVDLLPGLFRALPGGPYLRAFPFCPVAVPRQKAFKSLEAHCGIPHAPAFAGGSGRDKGNLIDSFFGISSNVVNPVLEVN